MRKYYSKCSKYLVSEFFNKGNVMYKTKIPNVFYKKDDDGIIYHFGYDKDDNIINKKEWSISQEDFLCDKWSVVHSYDELHGSLYLEIFNAYDKYCEENKNYNYQKLRIHEYLCYFLTDNIPVFIESKKITDDISENNNLIYLVKILTNNESVDEMLFSIDSETYCICFYEEFYELFKQNDEFDKVIEDNREFIKFLCEYKLSNIKQNQNIFI